MSALALVFACAVCCGVVALGYATLVILGDRPDRRLAPPCRGGDHCACRGPASVLDSYHREAQR